MYLPDYKSEYSFENNILFYIIQCNKTETKMNKTFRGKSAQINIYVYSKYTYGINKWWVKKTVFCSNNF